MTNASRAILVDTNVLVYPFDPRDRVKQERASRVVESLILSGQAVLSVQCLTEFYNVATRRLPEPLSPPQAVAQTERFARSCRVLNLTPICVLEGCRLAALNRLQIWDALIWAVARLNQVPYVLTEDAEHDRFLEGVRFLNPFAPEFDPRIVGLSD